MTTFLPAEGSCRKENNENVINKALLVPCYHFNELYLVHIDFYQVLFDREETKTVLLAVHFTISCAHRINLDLMPQ